MRYVYLLESVDRPDQRYVGLTTDLRKRLAAHNSGQSIHTARHKPWRLVTYVAFADAAADPDARGLAGAIDSVGVDELAGVGDLAAETQDIAPVRHAERPRALDHAAGHADVANPVRHLRQLHKKAVGRGGRLMDVPQGT